MPASIRQSVTLKASPFAVYNALMDSRQHSKFTGSRARISRRVGGQFSTFDGWAAGQNLALTPGRKIVQTWRARDWPKGRLSRVTFSLRKVARGTKLSFSQTGVPRTQVVSMKKGWIEYYWTPLKDLFGQ